MTENSCDWLLEMLYVSCVFSSSSVACAVYKTVPIGVSSSHSTRAELGLNTGELSFWSTTVITMNAVLDRVGEPKS